jgi:hypothetical protein
MSYAVHMILEPPIREGAHVRAPISEPKLHYRPQGQAQVPPKQTVSKARRSRILGATEGCYNTFDSLLEIDFGIEATLSNAKVWE